MAIKIYRYIIKKLIDCTNIIFKCTLTFYVNFNTKFKFNSVFLDASAIKDMFKVRVNFIVIT